MVYWCTIVGVRKWGTELSPFTCFLSKNLNFTETEAPPIKRELGYCILATAAKKCNQSMMEVYDEEYHKKYRHNISDLLPEW